MATAGVGAGIWVGADAASSAFVGFATEALERSMASMTKGDAQKKELLDPGALSESVAGSAWAGAAPVMRTHRKHIMYRRLSNMHRHLPKVEALDLAYPVQSSLAGNRIGDWETVEVDREVIVAVLSCALLCSAGSMLYGWMRLQKLDQLRMHRKTVLETQQQRRLAEEAAASSDPEELDEAEMFEEQLLVEASSSSMEGDEQRDTVPDLESPFLDSTSQSMHRRNMNLQIKTSSSQTTIRRVRSSEFRKNPTIYDIRRYFLIPEEAGGNVGHLPKELLGTSVPGDYSGASFSPMTAVPRAKQAPF